jgi:hypothetical protein
LRTALRLDIFIEILLGTSVHTGNFLFRIANSTAVSSPCPLGYWSCIRSVFRRLSLESLSISARVSPSSGAKAATYTRPTTLLALVAALVITAPP